jgi:glycosyltransferase involved in cell wall biosynthesis
MTFGLPIIVSNRVGCAQDLVIDEVNGMVFESGNLEALAACIKKMVNSGELRRAYGRNSLKIISGYTLEENTRQVVHALLSATGLVERAKAAAQTADA